MANGTGKFLGGLLLGGAIGTVIGLLVAPRSGRETRRMLRKSANELPELAENMQLYANQLTDQLTETAQRTLEETVDRLQEAIVAGQEASQRLRQELNMASQDAATAQDDEALR